MFIFGRHSKIVFTDDSSVHLYIVLYYALIESSEDRITKVYIAEGNHFAYHIANVSFLVRY